ncbi:hypothetical protein ABKV19_009224 [Rosa sericea]
MASKLPQLQTKLVQVSNLLAKNGNTYYKQMMEKNKGYIQEPPTIENCQTLAKQLFYTRLASIPSRYEAIWKELEGLKDVLKTTGELNVEKAGIIALFGVECFAWFWTGEVVGRGGTITGYYV